MEVLVSVAVPETTFMYVTNPETLKKAIQLLVESPEIAIDTETAFSRDSKKLVHSTNVYNQNSKGEPAPFDPHTAEARLIQLKGRNTPSIVIDLWALNKKNHAPLISFLKSYPGTWIGHNIKFDLKIIFGTLQIWLDQGPYLGSNTKVFCTFQASRLIANSVGLSDRGHRLADIARDFLSIDLDKTEQSSDWSRVVLSKEQLEYAALDVVHLHDLYDIMREGLIQDLKQEEPVKLEMSVIGPTARMEYNGIPFSLPVYTKVQQAARYAMPALLQQIGKYFKDEVGQTVSTVYLEIERPDGSIDLRPFQLPWGSGKAGKDFLMSKSRLVLDMLKNLGLRTEEDEEIDNVQKATLEVFRETYPGVGYLVDYWGVVKQSQFEYDKYIHPITGCVHASFHPSGASTGRFSSSTPNLQQVPGKFFMKHPDGSRQNYRYCFEAKPKWLMCSADFSGQELSVMAALSQDEIMINTLRNNGDLHSEAAAGMFNIDPKDARQVKPGDTTGKTYRDYGKIVMFSLAYGKTAKGFASDWKIPEQDAQKIIDNFESRFSTLAKWLKHQGELGATQNWSRLPNGAMRFVGGAGGSELASSSAARRQSANYQIQGISSWMTRIAMISLDKEIKEKNLNLKLVACVHDELLCTFAYWDECPYGLFCADQDKHAINLTSKLEAAKKAKNKEEEKEFEQQINVYVQELKSICKTTCEGHDCATMYEETIGFHMKRAGDIILNNVVPAGYSVATKKYWSH